jgi:hypothetical protein
MNKGFVISDERFHNFLVRRLISFIEETDDYIMVNYNPGDYAYPEWERVYLNVLMDEIHPFLYRFKDIPHDRIYDEIKRTLTIVLKDKMKSMYDANRISESVGISVKRRGIELFKSARDTYPYLYPCDYDRDSYIQSILDAFEDITMGYSLELENMGTIFYIIGTCIVVRIRLQNQKKMLM